MYSELFEIQAQLYKALSHPRRLEIVHLLRDQELPVTDIHTMLDLPQANISQHLMVLRDAQIVTARKEGKQIYYHLADPRIMEACDTIREVLIDTHKESNLADELLLTMKDLVPLTQDPVCGMRVSPKTAGFHTKHNGSNFYFCASGCYATFIKNPRNYV